MKKEDRNGEEALSVLGKRDKPLTKPGIIGHQWRQQGPYLVCTSCPVKHTVWIGTDRQLVGFNKKGEPLLRKVEFKDKEP